MLGRASQGSCRYNYGLKHQQMTGQEECAYCGMSLVDTFEHWLQIALDHVIPRSAATKLGIPAEWIEDYSNRVLCCGACNTLDNRCLTPEDALCPLDEEEFFNLRDRMFLFRKERIALRRDKERNFYLSKPWDAPLPIMREM